MLVSKITALSQEQPPFDFRVEYFWKAQGVAFNRLALFNTILYDMGFLGMKDWNFPVAAAKLPAPYGIYIGFVGDRSGPGLKVKHLMWALEEMFDIFEEQKRYAPGSVVVEVTPARLGVGNVHAALSDSKPTNSTGMIAGSVPDTTFERVTLPLDDMAYLTSSTISLNESDNSSNTKNIIPNQTLSGPARLNAAMGKDISVDFRYRPNGASLDDAQVYNTSLKMVIKAGEQSDRLESIGAILATYNPMDNFTFSFVSEPFVKGKVLTWTDSINSVSGIIFKMASRGPGGMWKEIVGFINDGPVVIGRFCIDKGDFTTLDPQFVCPVRRSESVSMS